MVWPAWLWVGTRLKFVLWLSNRLATWTGLFFVWRRWRSRRLIWLWLGLLNLVSLGGLLWFFFWRYAKPR